MVTYTLLALILFFSITAFNKSEVFEKYSFHPWSVYHQKEHYRFLSHAFIHSNPVHLVFNCLALYSFGQWLEYVALKDLFGEKMGKIFLILLYTGGIYAAAVTEYFMHRNNKYYTSIGASGAISSLIFCSIIISPNNEISFFFLPKMPGWIMGLLLLALSFFLMERKRSGKYNDSISHEAHFWGAIFGIIFILLVRPETGTEFLEQVMR